VQESPRVLHGRSQEDTDHELAKSVQGLKMACNSDNANDVSCRSGGHERVSFGTYMSTNEEVSDDASMQRAKVTPPTAVERFHARKFGDKGNNADKRYVLKVTGWSGNKRQRILVKSVVKDVLQALVKDEIEDMARENMERNDEMMEDELTAIDTLSKLDPKTLTGSLDEAHQEQ
jgi:hypothetical protein